MRLTALSAALGTAAQCREAFRGLDILVVDDDADGRDVLRDVLLFYGARVRTVASAERARVEIARARPNLILSDIMMPDEDGLRFIASVRAGEDGAQGPIPAVAISANPSSACQASALAAGFQEFLVKPYELTAILAIVARFVPEGVAPSG